MGITECGDRTAQTGTIAASSAAGKIAQEIKTLGEDHRLDEARLELNATLAQILTQTRRWQSLATTSHILETIRTNYEAERQPETLREASYFLEKLTGGQYSRIWTRLIGEELLVDNANKETLRRIAKPRNS